MRKSSKVLKFGSSKIWLTAQKPSFVFFVPSCETIKDNDRTTVTYSDAPPPRLHPRPPRATNQGGADCMRPFRGIPVCERHQRHQRDHILLLPPRPPHQRGCNSSLLTPNNDSTFCGGFQKKSTLPRLQAAFFLRCGNPPFVTISPKYSNAFRPFPAFPLQTFSFKKFENRPHTNTRTFERSDSPPLSQ